MLLLSHVKGLELSVCGAGLSADTPIEEVHRAFGEGRVGAAEFSSRGREIMASKVGLGGEDSTAESQ